MRKLFILIALLPFIGSTSHNPETNSGGWEELVTKTQSIGKPKWRPMLKYVAKLHKTSTHPAEWPFDYPWEEIGPGYHLGPAFGHWDIVHQVIDVLPAYPDHAVKQLLNNIKNQEIHGLVPGCIWMPSENRAWDRDSAEWSREIQGHPPLWIAAVDDYIDITGQDSILQYFYTPLVRQISWFENKRKAETGGFFYQDILTKDWESGVDEGIRFDETTYGKWACIDATSHVYYMYRMAVKWSDILDMDKRMFKKRAEEIKRFIQDVLYDEADGLFYDIWAIQDPQFRTLAFETLFPLVVGAATASQADRLIDEYLLDTACFNTAHPITSVGRSDPKFELRCWRGPAWNSMTYWVARGCVEYGREDAAKIILEKALDDSAKWFDRTGTVWEFYHPFGGDPRDLLRKPQTSQNTPCTDYLGHNPVIAMTRLYDKIKN